MPTVAFGAGRGTDAGAAGGAPVRLVPVGIVPLRVGDASVPDVIDRVYERG